MIAVLVPVHNEAGLLDACLASIRTSAAIAALQGERVEIVVALDRCTDASGEIARAHGAHVVALRAGAVGAARGAAAECAIALGARWLANTDGDTRVPADWLVAQVAIGADAFCGMVAVDDWLDRPAAVVEAFQRRHPALTGHRHVHGANLGLSADAYRRCGGFAPLASGEDVALVDALERMGMTIARLPQPRVITSSRRDGRARGGFADYLSALEEVAGLLGPPVAVAS